MKKMERDARLKLLALQGAIYRGEIVEAKIGLCQASKPFAMSCHSLGDAKAQAGAGLGRAQASDG